MLYWLETIAIGVLGCSLLAAFIALLVYCGLMEAFAISMAIGVLIFVVHNLRSIEGFREPLWPQFKRWLKDRNISRVGPKFMKKYLGPN